jgi:hypothetical protein
MKIVMGKKGFGRPSICDSMLSRGLFMKVEQICPKDSIIRYSCWLIINIAAGISDPRLYACSSDVHVYKVLMNLYGRFCCSILWHGIMRNRCLID